METMRKTGRVFTRIALAAAMTAATFAVATPAQAHPTVSGPHCDAGAGFWSCLIGISGAVPPIDIKWFVNGQHRPAFDDRTHISGGCGLNERLGLRVRVTDASGVPVEKSRSVFCGPIIP
jgi:hypothetical protein